MSALGLDAKRRVAAQPAAARAAVLEALRDADFRVTAEQVTRIEAKRGSRLLGGAMMTAKSQPVVAQIEFDADGTGCVVVIRLGDEHINLGGRAWGWNRAYRAIFTDVAASIDRALARLDPAAASGFETPAFWTRGGEIGALEQAQTKSLHIGGRVVGKANELLEGGRHRKAPAAWRDVAHVAVVGRRGWAVLTLDDAQAHLGIAVMVDADMASLPANLRTDVASLAARLEAALTDAPDDVVLYTLEPPEEPVLDFLHQQTRIRSSLPARTLHRCRTCHFEKVTNEDLERIQTRNSRLRNLVGGVGATISGSSVQPFVVLGQLFKFKKLDPDYVCPRCQGLEADERLVTFCPGCGELRAETVLRACPKCAHDFRGSLEPETFWLTPDEAAAVLRPDAPSAGSVAASPGVTPAPPSPPPPGLPLGAPPAVGDASPSAAPPVPPPPAGWSAGPARGSPSDIGAPTTPPAVPCPRCALPVSPGDAFCGHCGVRLR